MNKGFFSESIKKPAFFSAMLKFNLEQYEKNAADSLNAAAEKYADSSFLSESFYKKYAKPKIKPFWDFADETKRLALMNSTDLQMLALLTGTSVHAEEISRTIEKNAVLALRSDLGTQLYSYALKRGTFQTKFLKTFFAHKDNTLSLLQKIRKHGEQAIAYCTYTWQDELTEIFCKTHEQTMPDLLHYIEEKADIPPEQSRMLWFSVKKLLIQELDSTWQNYFN